MGGRKLRDNTRSEIALAREAARRRLKERTMTEVKSLAITQTKLAINTLVQIMRNDEAPAAARVSAAIAILDRGWGKPLQVVASEGGDPIELVHRIERHIIYPNDPPPVSVLGSTRATGDFSQKQLPQLPKEDKS